MVEVPSEPLRYGTHGEISPAGDLKRNVRLEFAQPFLAGEVIDGIADERRLAVR
jgi:hypothetical protein